MKPDSRWALFFFAAAGLALHPSLLYAPSRDLIAGSQVGGYYAWLYSTWYQAWQLGASLTHTASVMYPAGVPLFPQSPVSDVLAVIIQHFASPYTAVNFLLTIAPVLSGWTAYLFFKRLTSDAASAWAGACTFAFSHYMLTQRLHGQVIEAALYFAPLLAWALIDYLEKPGIRGALRVGAAFAAVGLCGPYVLWTFGTMFLLAAAVFDLCWGKRQLLKAQSLRLAAVLAAAAAALALVYWPLLKLSGALAGGSEFYSLTLASFIDPPYWHRSALMQAARPLAHAAAYPETIMAYVGLANILVIALAWARFKREPRLKFWLWCFAWGALMGLGPKLIWAPGIDSGIPLPYALFQSLPVVSMFRNTGRMMTLGSFAVSALVALSLANISARWPWRKRWLAAIALVAATFAELDVPAAINWTTPTRLPAIYARIKSEPGPSALLELPNSCDSRGTPLFQSQLYMMYQPQHGRPLILGAPTRYLPDALTLTETTDFLYELTHPWVLERLETDSKLAGRARQLAREGASILRAKGIKHVLFHSRIAPYGQPTQERLKRLLDKVLGAPIEADEEGRYLYSAGERRS